MRVDIAEFLVREREVVVGEAEEALTLLRERHDETAGTEEVRRRLDHAVRPPRPWPSQPGS